MAEKQFRPMKMVQDHIDFEDLRYPKDVSLKVDGAFWVNLKEKSLARSLKPFANEWLTDTLSDPMLDGFVGEVVNANQTDKPVNRQSACRDTTSCTNTKKLKDWDFEVYLFDYVGDGTQEYCSIPRRTRMETMLGQLNMYVKVVDGCEYLGEVDVVGFKFKHFKFLNEANGVYVNLFYPIQIEVDTSEKLEALYEHSISNGGEGVVAAEPLCAYKFGRATAKSQECVRYKPQGDSEIVITAFEQMYKNENEAKTNELGYTERSSHQENKTPLEAVGSIIGLDINSGETVKIGAGEMDWAEREKVWKGKESYIGMIAKYAYMDSGIKSKPRHPRFKGWRSVVDLDTNKVVALCSNKSVYLSLEYLES